MRRLLPAAALIALLPMAMASAQNRSSQSQASETQSQAARGENGISPAEIATARAAHKVWVNLDTGIYHKGGLWYGKTKNGRFMSADEAKKAGYKPAKRD